MRLHVNIDHVATLRNARGEGYPDPVKAAKFAEQSGAAGIVFHLRGDRRHILDADARALKKEVKGVLNFEMAATEEMIGIQKEIQADVCTLVPEGRKELTTEGGLNMKGVFTDFKERVFPELRTINSKISLFLDPVADDIKMAGELGAEIIELHTGTFANAVTEADKQHELERLKKAAESAHSLGIRVTAGHGLNLENLPLLLKTVPYLQDVSIGHALISKSVFWGLEKTIGEYLNILNSYTLQAQA